MITTLHIKNIGIIDDLSVELNNGFNVFTGETGAGKTLIIDALNIISGGRFSKDMIRRGEEYSFIEINLFLPLNENSIENNIIVSREIHSNGKNSCKINGRLVTVTELKDFMKNIIDIHGQNDNQKILEQSYHIKYIDNFAQCSLTELLTEYKHNFGEYCALKKELKANYGDEREKKRELDLLQYEFDEIESANLKLDEESELKSKSLMFENGEKIANSLSQGSDYCRNAVDSINSAIKAVDKISNLDEKYEKKLMELKNIYYEIEELSHDISGLNDNSEFDPNERDFVEERLDLISNFKRKYGSSIKEILDYKGKVEKEITRINNLDEYNLKLKAEIKQRETKMVECAKQLHILRCEASKELESRVNKELAELEMPNAKFHVSINEKEAFDKNGTDNIEFMITTNIGEDEKPLNKIASGGEMSRIMLAIKTVLANTDQTPVMIFDEIDTGISGKAAKSVGQKLKIIGNNHQVICITHQPSIAAKGDENYFISKTTDKNRTHTMIKRLSEDEIIDEIARISNGDITDIARQHAIELRKTA